MICRPNGDRLVLVRQHDHGRLAAELAESLSEQSLPDTPRRKDVLDAVKRHDSGWESVDDRITLGADGRPADVFSAPTRDSVDAWTESVRITTNVCPYGGLLTSIHMLGLSLLPRNPDHPEHADPKARFLRIRFQQNQIEHQQKLRNSLGFRTDLPLKAGLVETGIDPAEDLLRIHVRLLAAMDQLSLMLCYGRTVFDRIPDWRTGGTIAVAMAKPDRLTVADWPFAPHGLNVTIPATTIPSRDYVTRPQAVAAVEAAAPMSWTATVAQADAV